MLQGQYGFIFFMLNQGTPYWYDLLLATAGISPMGARQAFLEIYTGLSHTGLILKPSS
jgi:hypothetical protein